MARLRNLIFYYFLPDGAIFSGLVYKGSIKQILALFLFSASAYYRANWINNAAIIVWVCWYGCLSVVCMCVIKKNVCMCMCVLVKFEREKLLQITNPSTVYTSGVLLASNGENLVLRPNKILLKAHFFEISISNLEHNLFRFMALIF